MTLTGTSARFEILATANLTSVNTIGSAQIGVPSAPIVYASPPDVAYSMAAFVGGGNTLSINLGTGEVVSGLVTGVSQVETATLVAAAGVTVDGVCAVSVASPEFGDDAFVVLVPLTVAEHTTASLIAAAIHTAFLESPQISARYISAASSGSVSLTDRLKRTNSAMLAIDIPTGLGITSASSANTTAGVSETTAYRISGEAWGQTDFEGRAIPSCLSLYNTTIRVVGGFGIDIGAGTSVAITAKPSSVAFLVYPDGDHPWLYQAVEFTPTDDCLVYIDVHAGTAP